MRLTGKILISTLILALCASEALSITIDEAVERALNNNHTLKGQLYTKDAAYARASQARAAFMPNIGLSYSYMKHQQATVLWAEESSSVSLQASYNLFSGLSDTMTYKGAKQAALAEMYMTRATASDVVLGVKSAYINVLMAQRMLETASESVDLLKRQRDEAELFFREGLIAKNELLKVEVELASSMHQLLQAEGNMPYHLLIN